METEKTVPGQAPRSALAQWANNNDEWIRRIVRLILGSNSEVSDDERAQIYRLFLEEKGFDDRDLPVEAPIPHPAQTVGQPDPLFLTRISEIRGVNALSEGEEIHFGPSLTLLFGENGTGKTGYVRVLKRIAGSRSADEILPDVNLKDDPPLPSAEISYRLGETESSYQWKGEQAQEPFNRMSIFDSPSVQLHVDSDLGYIYSPASLAIFDRVTVEVQQIGKTIEGDVQTLKFNNSNILSRFDSRSSIYPYIQSLGSGTNLSALQQFTQFPDDADAQKQNLETTIAQLRADAVGQQIILTTGFQKILVEALTFASVANSFEASNYNAAVSALSDLQRDQVQLRDSLFAAAGLPAKPDHTWETFVRSGQEYRKHLESLGVHDTGRCLYCRQMLGGEALQLISKYSDYLENQIAKGIEEQKATIQNLVKPLQDSSLNAVRAYVDGLDADSYQAPPQADADQTEAIRAIVAVDDALRERLANGVSVDEKIPIRMSGIKDHLVSWLTTLDVTLAELQKQNSAKGGSIAKKETELCELMDRLALNESWIEIEHFVASAKRAEKFSIERGAVTNVLRGITRLSTQASEQLINKNFEQIFLHECTELRAPELRLEFFGREGQPQRRRTLPSAHKPSRVLSEGEQKVIAVADFIAETKMSEVSVPIIFDDPVSSLDHRRTEEVATRIADLASVHQVIVFTHDIFFTACLLDIFDKSDGCVYYRVTDEDGKGTVTPGTGPRWDTIRNLTTKINSIIEEAKQVEGEAREAHVREAYSSIRSWCELFVEQDMLAKVTERYQPNVRMTNLARINISALGATIETVTAVFEEACRYIDAHSQPLSTLGVAPTLSQVQVDWKKLMECRTEYRKD